MKITITLFLWLLTATCLVAQSGSKTIPVRARENSTVENWETYQALTVENLKGYKKRDHQPYLLTVVIK
ncbi:MAG: hypothetical protein LUD74_07610 [Tannerellaceae bacterium]|nr:hypothetical protein [Tannerellaceae bacterium]